MLNLLVADDNPISLDFFIGALGQLGHRCVGAVDGLAAVDLGNTNAFDLLLLDACMPGLDGMAALAQIRAGNGPSRLSPALATTASDNRDRHAELVAAGFDAVLIKPIRMATLAQALRSYRSVVAEPLIDERRALDAVGGAADIALALRGLLLAELDALPGELGVLSHQSDGPAALSRRLHRLLASAGFCGVLPLEQSVRQLEATVLDQPSWPEADVDIFLQRAQQIAGLLRQHGVANT